MIIQMVETPLDRGQKVVLNSNEQKIAVLMGEQRYKTNREMGIKNRKAGSQPVHQTEVEGVGGELAFGKVFNLYPDLATSPGDYDFKMVNTTIDVKTTHYFDGHLLVPTTKKISECDVYVLVVGEMPSYTIVGWLQSQHIINDEHRGDLGTGTVYLAEQTELQGFPINIYAKEFQGK
mgnify:CR=1 FL=1